jgi:hypothetical protein
MKTFLDARMLTQKPEIPQKFCLPDQATPEQAEDGRS